MAANTLALVAILGVWRLLHSVWPSFSFSDSNVSLGVLGAIGWQYVEPNLPALGQNVAEFWHWTVTAPIHSYIAQQKVRAHVRSNGFTDEQDKLDFQLALWHDIVSMNAEQTEELHRSLHTRRSLEADHGAHATPNIALAQVIADRPTSTSVLMGILSARENLDLRNALRETWLTSLPSQAVK
jgi:hypothetical protein